MTDWRIYGLALIGLPVFSSLGLGTVGPLLLLLLAIGWRFRGSPWSGVALALAAAAKLFLWPVLVWLVARRYYRATAAAAITLSAIVAVWAAADPTGLSRYPETVRLLNIVQRWKSYSLQTLWFRFGLPAPVLVAIVLGVLGALLVVFTRSSRRSFALAVVVSVLASPILWVHYYVLLLAPLALARPRLGPMWIVPFALWVTPHPESSGSVWKIAVVLVAGVAIALLDPDALVRTDSARAKVRRVTPRWVMATLRD